PALAKELDIRQVPCIVRFGDHEFRDRVDLSASEFYTRLVASETLPTTSQPATGVFQEMYENVARQTNEILAIHTIASLSGIFNASRVAAESIANAKIELIDSKQVTMALGWLVILAARAAREGHSLEEIKALVEDAIPRVHVIGALNTLEYAQRGGRLGKGAALVGTLLNVKPLISIVGGEVVPVENTRSQKRALERLVEIVLGSGPIQEIAVIHAAGAELAERVKKMLAATLREDQIIVTETGPVLGTHVGPNAVGIAWVTGKY
ncbi:MAG: DegV family protein, partial [Chloroflexota bacterium]|nr:DegV family protein [Chloroflexota bacterium]